MIYDNFKAMITREIEDHQEAITRGLATDYVAYREMVATIRAYRDALEIAKKAFQEDDDEDVD